MNIIFVYRFCSDVNIMCISDKCLANQFDIRRHLISLLKAWVEGIEHNNDVHFGSIGEVRPVESISHVIFVDGALDVRIVMVSKMWAVYVFCGLADVTSVLNMLVLSRIFVALFDVDNVNVEEFSDFHYCF